MTDARLAELLGRSFWSIDDMDAVETELARARASEVEKAAEIERLKADNAALLAVARRYDAFMDLSEPWNNGDLGIEDASGLNEASATLHALIVGTEHPGAVLLEALKQKEEQVKALGEAANKTLNTLRAWHKDKGEWLDCQRVLDAALRLAGLLP